MPEKTPIKKISSLLNVILTVLFCFILSNNIPVSVQQKSVLNNVNKIKILQQITCLIELKYVFPDMAKKYAEEFKYKYESGCYNSFTNSKDFAEQITADLISITGDKHINFRVIESSEMGEKSRGALHHPIRYHLLSIKENKGFYKMEWLDSNIGYLDIRRFYYISDIEDMVDASIKFLSNADAIIIDLRENGGGSGDYLSSYFLNHPTQLNSWYSREDNFLTEFWTSKKIRVKRLTDVPLFLLTSKRTFSAAESFAYDMKVRKRAVVVGDSTKGGAHSVDLFKIENDFEIYIPTARAINPITKNNWEGTGVIPDIIVPSASALDTAIVLAKKAGKEYAKAKEKKLKLAVEAMEIYMERVEIAFRENINEAAAIALDSVFQIAGKHDLINEFFIDVLAYNYFSEKDENILYAILKKKVELFPKSPTAHETLAYAYYKNNKKDLAVEHFEKVLELEPENGNALRMIRRIRKE